MRYVALLCLMSAAVGAAPPAAVELGPTVSVVRDRLTQRPTALFGLRLAAADGGEAGARGAVMSLEDTLGLAPCELGRAQLTRLNERTVVSFELVATVQGERLVVADRRVAATVVGGIVTKVQSDAVPLTVPSKLGSISARGAQERVHAKYGGPVTTAEPRLLVIGAHLAEPVWRMTVAVVPLADHRVVDVSRRTGRIVHESPGLADGAHVEVRR